MNLNLFGSDDDDQSSRFVVNLKKETYDPLLITFNAITAGTTKTPELDKDTDKGSNYQTINLLSQSMLTASASAPVDLDAEEKKTQNTSCDYVAFVPTSFDVSIDTVNAFYKSKNDFKQTLGKVNMNDAVSSVFMQWTMFEQFVKFVKKNAHKRELALIEQSYKEAIIKFKPLGDGMNNVLNLTVLRTNLDATPTSKPTADLNQRFVILYTTPTNPPLPFLPLASEFVNPGGPFHGAITQKALTYFCNYFQYLCMKQIGGTSYSVGRIPNYLPALNSNVGTNVKATNVNFLNNDNPVTYAKPSYNIELIPNFLMGIMNTKGLPNRATLAYQDKFKVIRDNTHLYTFKSTTEYSMNYETLLNRLYYKYPCHLTPIATVTKDAMTAIATASKAAAVAAVAAAAGGPVAVIPFNTFLRDAIAATETKSYSIICAVAIATQEYIYYNEDAVGGNSINISNNLFNTIDFGTRPGDIKSAIVNAATAVLPLNPLIGAACAAGDAVYSAAKRAITTVVMADANATSKVGMTAIQAAMKSEIDNLNNFAAFMYDNNTLLSLMKYSDQPQMINAAFDPNNTNILPQNLLENANYLNTLYANQPQDDQDNPQNLQQKTQTQLQKQQFDVIDDDVLYTICGPVYFDYTWIFKQNPELIKHILGEDKRTSETSEWTYRTDLLTENNHYVNYGQKDPNLPKMRFDTKNSLPSDATNEYNQRLGAYDSKKTYKEIYVSPSEAKSELDNVGAIVAAAAAFTDVQDVKAIFEDWNRDNETAADTIKNPPTIPADLARVRRAIYDWTTPGYYRYEITNTVANEAYVAHQAQVRAGRVHPQIPENAKPPQLLNRFTQLMRPPTQENGVQDYTEPNLPTSYPPPLMFITPPMRDPTNTFMIHAWIPDLSSENSPSFSKFMSDTKVLKRDVYMDYMYKMMQLIFNTATMNSKNVAKTNASGSGSANRNCIKIMAIGYKSVDQNLKAINTDDKTFIGDAFFYAVRDYSMLNESAANNVHVTVYYDTANQSEIKQRYDEYVSQRESRLQRISGSASVDTTLKLKIQTVDDFFTLKYTDTLQNTDLLHFVDYCSTPRAFIGNCGEWPNNIEDVMDQAITNVAPTTTQPLLKCMNAALDPIARLYVERNINEKITQISKNLAVWNDDTIPKTSVGTYNTLKNYYLNYATDNVVYNAFNNVPPHTNGKVQPRNINISWWQGVDDNSANSLPRNAYMSSFDEHVLILHNLLNNANAAAVLANDAKSRWVGGTKNPYFARPTPNNMTANYGPFINENETTANNPRADATFENAVYAYTQAKKILTLLAKMGSDNIQILQTDQAYVKTALDALTVDMSWSMDAKFTAAVAEGAFIPNSSALHNPFMCTKLLDPKEWKFVDFKDIAVSEINGVKQLPLQSQLKRIVDNTIGRSVSTSSAVADSGIMISKQPNVDTLKKNIGIILENMFHKDGILKYAGKNMVFNNYSWPDQLLYYKMRNNPRTQQLTASAETTATSPNFAELMGLLPQSGTCIGFPLFVIQLMFYLFEGNAADITGMDKARLSCALDGNMFKTNAQIIWEQMMKNMKTHEQNFTMTHLLNRLGSTTDEQVYSYDAYFDGNVPPVSIVSIVAAAAKGEPAVAAAAAQAEEQRLKTASENAAKAATDAAAATKEATGAKETAAQKLRDLETEVQGLRMEATRLTEAKNAAIAEKQRLEEQPVVAAVATATASLDTAKTDLAFAVSQNDVAANQAEADAATAALAEARPALAAAEAALAAANATLAASSLTGQVEAAKAAARSAIAAVRAANAAVTAATRKVTTATREVRTATREEQHRTRDQRDATQDATNADTAFQAAAAAAVAAAAAAASALTAALAGVGSADILIDAVNSATIPTLKTTNSETLTRLNTSANQTMYNNPPYIVNDALSQITLNPAYNSIGSIAKIAEIFNDVEMRGAAGAAGDAKVIQGWTTALATIRATTTGYVPKTITPGWNSRIGWNAAIQTQSTMLYVNVNAKLANGSVKNITLDLTTSLKPGDKILITDETLAKIKKRQMWVVTKKPFVNETFSQVMNVPVSFTTARLTNLIRTILPGDDNIPNGAPLTVTFQHFTQDNLD